MTTLLATVYNILLLHILAKRITVTKHPIFGVPGIQQAKICPKVKSHNIDNIVYIYIYSSTRHLQSLGTISFVVSGNEPAKIYAKVN